MKRNYTPDNFELVYDGHAWHGPSIPARIMALVLMALKVRRR
jgi:hypothetical protein